MVLPSDWFESFPFLGQLWRERDISRRPFPEPLAFRFCHARNLFKFGIALVILVKGIGPLNGVKALVIPGHYRRAWRSKDRRPMVLLFLVPPRRGPQEGLRRWRHRCWSCALGQEGAGLQESLAGWSGCGSGSLWVVGTPVVSWGRGWEFLGGNWHTAVFDRANRRSGRADLRRNRCHGVLSCQGVLCGFGAAGTIEIVAIGNRELGMAMARRAGGRSSHRGAVAVSHYEINVQID